MNIIFRIIWGIILNDPINLGDIETSGGHVCTEQDSGFGVAKLKVGRGAFRLLLLPVNGHARNVDIVEELNIRYVTYHMYSQ